MVQRRAQFVGFSLAEKGDASEFGRLVAAARTAFPEGVPEQSASDGMSNGWLHSFAIPTKTAEGPARHKEANELRDRLVKWLKAQQPTVLPQIYWEADSQRSYEFTPDL